MLPFTVDFQSGAPVSEQILYAVKKALVCGRLIPGDSFPSVRLLSQELRIHPNTAHKVISTLVAEGLLEIRPGIGSVVTARGKASTAERAELLGNETERLVVQARQLNLKLEDVLDAVTKHWGKL